MYASDELSPGFSCALQFLHDQARREECNKVYDVQILPKQPRRMGDYIDNQKEQFVAKLKEVKEGVDTLCRSNNKHYLEKQRNKELDALHTFQEEDLVQIFDRHNNVVSLDSWYSVLKVGFVHNLLMFDKAMRYELSRGVQSLQTFVFDVSSYLSNDLRVFLECLYLILFISYILHNQGCKRYTISPECNKHLYHYRWTTAELNNCQRQCKSNHEHLLPLLEDFLKAKTAILAESYPESVLAVKQLSDDMLNKKRREKEEISTWAEKETFMCLRTSPATMMKNLAKNFLTDLQELLKSSHTKNPLLVVIQKPESTDKDAVGETIEASFLQRAHRLNEAFADIDRRMKKCWPFACNEIKFNNVFHEVRRGMFAMRESIEQSRKNLADGKSSDETDSDAKDFEKELRDLELESFILFDMCKVGPSKDGCENTFWGI